MTLEDLYGAIEVILFPKVFLQYAAMISENNVIAVSGTLSLEEEKDAKILVNAVFKPNSLNAENTERTETKRKSRRSGLFLKFLSADDERIRKASVITSIFDGSLPLYFYYEDTKKYILQPRSAYVDVNDTMLKELKKLLGDKNVAVIN